MSLTPQEILDRVTRHLLTQGQRAGVGVPLGFSCKYRDPSGRKCAIGCLIPDEVYEPCFEEATLGLISRALGLHQHLNFLSELQNAHDFNNSPPEDWNPRMKKSLQEIADRWGLKLNPPGPAAAS